MLELTSSTVWHEIWKDFCKRHPYLADKVSNWETYGYMTILLIIDDENHTMLTYNHETKCLKPKGLA